MIGRLYIVAEIYLHVFSGDAGSWQKVGSLYKFTDLTSMEACQDYLDEGGQDYIAFFEKTARGLWLDELDVEPDSLRVEINAQCYVPSL